MADVNRALRRIAPVSAPCAGGEMHVSPCRDAGAGAGLVDLTLRCGTLALHVAVSPGLLEAALASAGLQPDRPRARDPGVFRIEIAFDPSLTLLEDRTGLPVSLSAGPPGGDMAFARSFRCRIGSTQGLLRLGFAPDALGAVGDLLAQLPEAAPRRLAVPLPARIELGTFDADPGQIARLRRGEALLPAAHDLSLARASLVLGSRTVAQLDISGDVARVTALRAGDTAPSEPDVGPDRIRLRFGVAHPGLTLDALRALAVGAAIPLPRPIDAARIDIRAGDRTIAHGALLRLGSHLAVQVREVRHASRRVRPPSQATTHGPMPPPSPLMLRTRRDGPTDGSRRVGTEAGR